jgi:NitT/TauT family transport system substrate-binding protein
MRLALPDLISNSYFPAVAAVELGCFAEQGIEATHELIFPVSKCYTELRDGEIDLVAGSAHSALAAFPEWEGVKLLCAQGQGMYWFLVMRSDLPFTKGDVSIVKGRSIGAAPWVDMGLRQLLISAGIDLQRDNVTIAPVPGAVGAGVNFGLTAAKALEERKIDGFWANGMGTAVAVQRGVGNVVLDIRRGDGPKEGFNFTMASIAATDRLIKDKPEVAAGAVRAVNAAHRKLKQDPSLAEQIARKVFPENEAKLITDIVKRDFPYYTTAISPDFVAGMNAFARKEGILKGNPGYEQVVAAQFRDLWTTTA